jgi:hypothetical protein
MLDRLLGLFRRNGRRNGRPRNDWAVLSRAGAGAFVRWGRDVHGTVKRAWHRCPRAEWLLAVAAGLELEPEVIERCMRDCAARLPRRSGGLCGEAMALADRWRDDPQGRDETLEAFRLLLERAVEQSPRLQKARRRERRAENHHLRDEGLLFSDHEQRAVASRVDADEVELSVMHGYADLVREQIPFAAIEGRIAARLAGPPTRG